MRHLLSHLRSTLHESAVVLPYNAAGNVLLQFRCSQAPTAPLMFSMFGGAMEPEDDYSPHATMARELREELEFDHATYQLLYFGYHAEPRGQLTFRRHIFTFHRPFTSPFRVLEGAGAAFLSRSEIDTLIARNMCRPYVVDALAKLP